MDDAKKLYSGFNLSDSKTSVSMTINGPAAIITAFYMNAAIDQQCELYIKEQGLVSEVETTIAKIYQGKEVLRPKYQGDLPQWKRWIGTVTFGGNRRPGIETGYL